MFIIWVVFKRFIFEKFWVSFICELKIFLVTKTLKYIFKTRLFCSKNAFYFIHFLIKMKTWFRDNVFKSINAFMRHLDDCRDSWDNHSIIWLRSGPILSTSEKFFAESIITLSLHSNWSMKIPCLLDHFWAYIWSNTVYVRWSRILNIW